MFEQEFGNAEELRKHLEEQERVLLSLREERLRLRDQLTHAKTTADELQPQTISHRSTPEGAQAGGLRL